MENQPARMSGNTDKLAYFRLDGREVKKISRKALYTRLEARINYLKDFLDFNSSMPQSLLSRILPTYLDPGNGRATN
jgi:hypothetical protein